MIKKQTHTKMFHSHFNKPPIKNATKQDLSKYKAIDVIIIKKVEIFETLRHMHDDENLKYLWQTLFLKTYRWR